jgi:hypothetical protein
VVAVLGQHGTVRSVPLLHGRGGRAAAPAVRAIQGRVEGGGGRLSVADSQDGAGALSVAQPGSEPLKAPRRRPSKQRN